MLGQELVQVSVWLGREVCSATAAAMREETQRRLAAGSAVAGSCRGMSVEVVAWAAVAEAVVEESAGTRTTSRDVMAEAVVVEMAVIITATWTETITGAVDVAEEVTMVPVAWAASRARVSSA